MTDAEVEALKRRTEELEMVFVEYLERGFPPRACRKLPAFQIFCCGSEGQAISKSTVRTAHDHIPACPAKKVDKPK